MKFRRFIRPVFISSLIAITIFLSLGLVWPRSQNNNSFDMKLQRPPFVSSAKAAPDIAAKLDEEAGISAYYKAPNTINLSQVRSAFRTIEIETGDYIIGSFPITGYPEHFDAHVYVHKDGWILAYYLRSNPVSKIVDVRARTLNTTNLRTAVEMVATTAGVPFMDVSYYDFRYPNATNMLLVAEDNSNGNDFTIKIPSSYSYFERAWAAANSCSTDVFVLNGTSLYNSKTWGGNNIYYGAINPSQLLPDTTHTVSLYYGCDGYAVLVLTYWMPQ